MFRSLPYIALFLTAALSQIFIFDNLAVSVYLAPLVYILFILLLPLETTPIAMLSTGIFTGVVMDAAMGTGGLNSIATIAAAFFRGPIINLIVGSKRGIERGTPSGLIFGERLFWRYLIIMISLHHLIFFLFETLSLTSSMLPYIALRFAVSTTVSTLFVWLIARLFSNNNILK